MRIHHRHALRTAFNGRREGGGRDIGTLAMMGTHTASRAWILSKKPDPNEEIPLVPLRPGIVGRPDVLRAIGFDVPD